MKKYNYEEFKNDPRTFSEDKQSPRYIIALIDCIDNSKTSPEEIFAAIDKIYSIGHPHSPSYIKKRKIKAIQLLENFIF